MALQADIVTAVELVMAYAMAMETDGPVLCYAVCVIKSLAVHTQV